MNVRSSTPILVYLCSSANTYPYAGAPLPMHTRTGAPVATDNTRSRVDLYRCSSSAAAAVLILLQQRLGGCAAAPPLLLLLHSGAKLRLVPVRSLGHRPALQQR
eukprot:GHVU01082063.1.p4 GENE.GHVU01082063.1~~GHVU01082063.1.p4  ORF type:complete len:104 (+),score=8.89 GHVU01082063.1:339-650(+)